VQQTPDSADPPMSVEAIHRELLAGVVSLRKIYLAMQRGELRSTKLGRRRVARRSWVEKWIDGEDQWSDVSCGPGPL